HRRDAAGRAGRQGLRGDGDQRRRRRRDERARADHGNDLHRPGNPRRFHRRIARESLHARSLPEREAVAARSPRADVDVLAAHRRVLFLVPGTLKGPRYYLARHLRALLIEDDRTIAELLARVQALVRRATRTPEPATLTVEDVVLDLLSRRVTRGGAAIDLRPREFTLLEYLMRNAGKVVSKTMILSHVWEYSFDPQTNVVDVLVSRLRDKIDRPFPTKLLRTVRGVGYVLG